jgi:hypothetical protein
MPIDNGNVNKDEEAGYELLSDTDLESECNCHQPQLQHHHQDNNGDHEAAGLCDELSKAHLDNQEEEYINGRPDGSEGTNTDTDHDSETDCDCGSHTDSSEF